MRGLKAALWIAVAMFATTGMAVAQTTTGTITGRVVDGQGLSVPGVTVNVAGPNLQGVLSAVTSENGDYIVPLLPPGTYTVTFELSGFERQQRSVNLAPTQTLPVNVTIGPAALSETVNVVGRTADVLTHTAQVATSFKQDLIATLPTNRDINATLLRAPAVHPTGPSGAYSIAGAMSFESLFMVNGVNVNENLRGQANSLYIEDAIQETTVATAGISAEYGRFSGGVVNVITKSGGNLFGGSFRDTLNNDNWRAYTVGTAARPWTTDCATCGAGSTPTKVDAVVPQYEYTLGGPIAKDRLWFFTAGRFINQQFSRSTVAPLSVAYIAENKRKRYEAKLTYAASSSHRVDGAYTKDALDQINDTFNTATSMDVASLYNRSTPQDLFTAGYNGILSSRLFLEARVSMRHFTFIGSGSPYTDLIKGTLLIDRNRGNLRYWAPTFCGVCDDEKRDNQDVFVKATHFLSTRSGGSHNMVFGYDNFNDKRFANNHQSGSDYRIIGTTSIVRGTDIFPQWLPGTSTVLQYDKILVGSQGTNFRTHSLFFNDNWRWSSRVTFNLGARFDKNHGVDAAGQLVTKDSGFSPRLGVVWDPAGDGKWAVSGSFAKYVAAISNSIADSSSPGGRAATFQWTYTGPAINPDATAATLVDSAAAIQRMFDWCQRDGDGFCRTASPSASSIPGVSVKIPDGLSSPNVIEYAGGISRQIGARAVARADFTYRDFRDFYSSTIDATTGTVVDSFGNRSDVSFIRNESDLLMRRYAGVTVSATYRITGRTDIGGNYSLSRLWGNIDGENSNSGPVNALVREYPEYRDIASWYAPEGDLSADQRHRSTMWVNYGVPRVDGLVLSLLQDLSSGSPYGALGTVDARPFVPASVAARYATPQGAGTEAYYYGPRDAFRTEVNRRTDFAANYNYGIGAGGRKLDLFIQAQVLNLFNVQDLCGCGASDVFANGGAAVLTRIGQSVLSPANTPTLARFNPLTTTPVLGTNWNYGANFGTALNRFAYTTPRTFRMTFGVRF